MEPHGEILTVLTILLFLFLVSWLVIINNDINNKNNTVSTNLAGYFWPLPAVIIYVQYIIGISRPVQMVYSDRGPAHPARCSIQRICQHAVPFL